jgi:hypothetical protein
VRNRRLGIVLGVVGLAVLAFAGIAGAAGTVTPNSNLVNNQLVNVDWSAMTPGQSIYITQCLNKPPAEIQRTTECSSVRQITVGGQFNATGSGETGTDAILNPDFRVFTGIEPGGDQTYACGPEGMVVPEGYTLYTTCLIRITDTSPSSTLNESFTPITFGSGTPVVPEAEFAVLLPLGALMLLGATFFIVRNRRSSAPAVAA